MFCACRRNIHSISRARLPNFGGIRYQSSFTFNDNASLLAEEQAAEVENGNGKNVHSGGASASAAAKATREAGRPEASRRTRKRDYSWFPVAPSTQHLTNEDIALSNLFSRQRPLTPMPRDDGVQHLILVLELSGLQPRKSELSEHTRSSEWNTVPPALLKAMAPFSPPPGIRRGGRRRPVLPPTRKRDD
ncbi:AaceriAAL087Cp [[Ashbya] aceris (nom. inval.)]|nr:AaceriAAL087Cp [[Ashbya] aceris (nom. inval.)]